MTSTQTLALSPKGRRYGFIPTPPTPDSLSLLSAPVVRTTALVTESDLEPWCGPVFDQGQQGSCTANAGCGNFEYLLTRFKSVKVILSRAFLYYQERLLDGTLDQGDCGSSGLSSATAMHQFGVCTDADMPYNPGDFSTAPTQAQMSEALRYTSGAHHLVQSVADIRSCLASNYPVLIGIAVYDSFESDNVANTGVVPMPDRTKEQLLGYHETLVIGHDDAARYFKVRNSWGGSWGKNGDFMLPYAFAADPSLLVEGRMQHLGKPW